MVAPSFQSMSIISETYTKNGRLYIDVKNEKTGTVRSVRWYTEKEYRAAYGKTAPLPTTPTKVTFHKPAAVRSMAVENTSTGKVIHATVAGDPRTAFVNIWQAYGAMKQEVKE